MPQITWEGHLLSFPQVWGGQYDLQVVLHRPGHASWWLSARPAHCSPGPSGRASRPRTRRHPAAGGHWYPTPSSSAGVASLGPQGTAAATAQGFHYSAQPHYPKPLTAASSAHKATKQQLGVRQITAREPWTNTISLIAQNGCLCKAPFILWKFPLLTPV